MRVQEISFTVTSAREFTKNGQTRVVLTDGSETIYLHKNFFTKRRNGQSLLDRLGINRISDLAGFDISFIRLTAECEGDTLEIGNREYTLAQEGWKQDVRIQLEESADLRMKRMIADSIGSQYLKTLGLSSTPATTSTIVTAEATEQTEPEAAEYGVIINSESEKTSEELTF